ncbi:MAG: hypothetical protein Q4E65_01180 [Clostridia bacterium]|nr:hypothetical protein [Clostridia bacterium]
MPIYLSEPSGFLKTVGRHPYRFMFSACALGLCILCGVSSNILFHGQDVAQAVISDYLCIDTAVLWRALLCAALWQTMLTCAVAYGREGGTRIAAALAAFGLEGFTYGFTLSELLFAYGEKGIAVLSLAAATCGMMGIVLRLYWFLWEEPTPADAGTRNRRKGSAPVRLIGKLAFLVLLQGLVTPLAVYLLRMD